MNDLKNQLVSALLVVLTAAGLISAGINYQQQKKFQLPDDGAVWVENEAKSAVIARYVEAGRPAERAGIKPGDQLRQINGYPIVQAIDASRVLARVGVFKRAEYTLSRNGVEFVAKVIVSERIPPVTLNFQYGVGAVYIAIGLFVYFRRSRAPRATHFYILCLASFVLWTFHYTGKLNNFDKVVYWCNVGASVLAPSIFLHFCLTFPEPRSFARRPWRQVLLYIPAVFVTVLYMAFASGMLRFPASLVDIRWALDRLSYAWLGLAHIAGAAILLVPTEAEDAVTRQQRKWLRNGAIAGGLPFVFLYVIPYALGEIPSPTMNLAVLSLAFIPVTWAYAILRYRLMDVDVVLQQGYAYTLATLAVLGVFYSLILATRPIEELDSSTLALLIMVAAFVFQPIRNWIQEMLDRYVFYKDRPDYRQTLVEFARELSAETNLAHMLQGVSERIQRSLFVNGVAVFLRDPEGDSFTMSHYSGMRESPDPRSLDLSFLEPTGKAPIFFERTRVTLGLGAPHPDPSVRDTIARLDLTYFVPCQARGRTIAYLGVSRTAEGDFLSSDDMELLTTVANSLGVAVESARLFRSLEQKVSEYERLKEFSENIVESISVGIVAASLDGVVESWNTQMEGLTGISREEATGRPLASLLPPRLIAALDDLPDDQEIHQIYKFHLSARPLSVAAAANGNGHLNGHANGHANGHSGDHRPAPERIVNVALAPLVTRELEKIGRLIIFDDVTERSELENKLIQADKLSSIGLLAAGVAHEVNTPLAVISNYAQMLTKQVSSDDPKSRLLEKIAKQTFRASEIVNSLLNFSRTGKAEMEPVDVNRVIRETLSMIEHQLKAGRVEVDTSLEDLPPVRASFGKLQQVFLNLFLNARDAMDSGGTLSVATRLDGDLVKIEVRDTGKGISADDMPRVFDPFFTTKGAKKGTGLGLAVSYGIVREHAGNISVQNAPGGGALFELDFPALQVPVNA